jgi:hypothetical protein
MAIKKTGTKYPIDVVEVPYKCSNKECEYSVVKSCNTNINEVCPWCGAMLIVMSGHIAEDLED